MNRERKMAIKIGTNIVGSTFYEQGHALKKMIDEKSDIGPAEVFTTDVASPTGARKLESGDLDIALNASNWVARAKEGKPPFGVKIDIRMVAPVNVGAGAIVGAGSTLGGEVAPDEMVVVRGRERRGPGAAGRFRERRRAEKAKQKGS